MRAGCLFFCVAEGGGHDGLGISDGRLALIGCWVKNCVGEGIAHDSAVKQLDAARDRRDAVKRAGLG